MKTSIAPKKQPCMDWHNADVKAALEKAGWSLSRLSIVAGYSHRNTLIRVLRQPWPLGELIIAYVLGTDPWNIWPSRYAGNKPNRGRDIHLGTKWHSIKARLARNENISNQSDKSPEQHN